LLRFLEGGCQIPIGTFGRIESGKFFLDAVVGSVDGKKIVRGAIHGAPNESEKIGVALAQELLSKGADEILREIRMAGS
jgi:hydroxymethylbilane synthase